MTKVRNKHHVTRASIFIFFIFKVVTTTQEPTKHIPKVEEKTTTKPQLIANPCIQAMDTGPCEGNVTRYYFDLTEKKCLQFTYGGCLGNDNNFQTLAACQSWCRAGK